MSEVAEQLLVDSRTAARMLSISTRTLWQLTKDGQIPKVNVTLSSVRYDVSDLKAWIEKRKK